MHIFVRKVVGYSYDELNETAQKKARHLMGKLEGLRLLHEVYEPIADDVSLTLKAGQDYGFDSVVRALTEAEQVAGAALDFISNDNAENTPSTICALYASKHAGARIFSHAVITQLQKWLSEFEKLTCEEPEFLFSPDYLAELIRGEEETGQLMFAEDGSRFSCPEELGWTEI